MAKWAKFHLNLGKTESGIQLLNQSLIQDMHRVTSAVPDGFNTRLRPKFPVSHVSLGYGYGWRSDEYRGNLLSQPNYNPCLFKIFFGEMPCQYDKSNLCPLFRSLVDFLFQL